MKLEIWHRHHVNHGNLESFESEQMQAGWWGGIRISVKTNIAHRLVRRGADVSENYPQLSESPTWQTSTDTGQIVFPLTCLLASQSRREFGTHSSSFGRWNRSLITLSSPFPRQLRKTRGDKTLCPLPHPPTPPFWQTSGCHSDCGYWPHLGADIAPPFRVQDCDTSA